MYKRQAGSIERLLDSFAAAPGAVHRLSYDGVPGSPVVFPKWLFPALAVLTEMCIRDRS